MPIPYFLYLTLLLHAFLLASNNFFFTPAPSRNIIIFFREQTRFYILIHSASSKRKKTCSSLLFSLNLFPNQKLSKFQIVYITTYQNQHHSLPCADATPNFFFLFSYNGRNKNIHSCTYIHPSISIPSFYLNFHLLLPTKSPLAPPPPPLSHFLLIYFSQTDPLSSYLITGM